MTDRLRARRTTLILIGAVAKAFLVHRVHHREHPTIPLGLPLWQQSEVAHFCGYKEHRTRVLARRDARAATDALRGVHRQIGIALRHRGRIRFGRRAGSRGDEATRLHDFVERRAVDHEVFDQRKCGRAEGLDNDNVTVTETAHVGLAGGDAFAGTVGLAVDRERAGTADAFTTIVRKRSTVTLTYTLRDKGTGKVMTQGTLRAHGGYNFTTSDFYANTVSIQADEEAILDTLCGLLILDLGRFFETPDTSVHLTSEAMAQGLVRSSPPAARMP